jgi:hypothetical protein
MIGEEFKRLIEMMSRQEYKMPYWMQRFRPGTVQKISKYEPHQGKKECERRRKNVKSIL